MIILGLHSAVAWDGNNSDDWSRIHDAGATLFINGRHHRSISEERLSRIKYDGDFAERSIDYVLGGISKEERVLWKKHTFSQTQLMWSSITKVRPMERRHFLGDTARLEYQNEEMSEQLVQAERATLNKHGDIEVIFQEEQHVRTLLDHALMDEEFQAEEIQELKKQPKKRP